MAYPESCEAIEPLLAPYGEPDCAELSAADRGRVAAHLQACEPCRRAADACRKGRNLLRAHAAELGSPAPQLLSARCRAIAAKAREPRRATRVAGWSALGAAAAVVLFIFLMPTQAVATQLALDHVKCTKLASAAHSGSPEQLEGFWRDRRQQQINIPDGNAAQGLRLIGLRRCISTEGNMAHVLYERAGAPISLFVLADGARPFTGAGAEVETIGQKAILWGSGAATYVLVGRAGDLAASAAWIKSEIERRKSRD